MKLTLIIIGAVLLSSCSTSFRIKSADQLDINNGIIQQVTKIAEYDVEPSKVPGSYTGEYDRKLANRSIQLAKELAVGDAISRGKCDFLIGPVYDISVTGRSITVNVTGYPAHYKDFKTQTVSDTAQLVVNQHVVVPTSNQTTFSESQKDERKRKRRKRIKQVSIAYLTTALVVGLVSVFSY